MDEAQFVRFLARRFPFSHGTGIGDDTSVVKAGDRFQLITKDLLIEDVHFSLDYYSIEEIALKAVAVNLSDIAAMGGEPLYFYLGLGFPKRLKEETAVRFFDALEKGCRQWNVELAGGDFSSSHKLYISVTMIGEAENPVFRRNAQAGDLIGITATVGDSATGLKLLQKGIRTGPLVQRHKSVRPETAKGQILAKYVNAMIDVSDGLLIDLERVLTASGKGAAVRWENIPVSPEMEDACAQHGLNKYETVLAGGEDYVLLFTLPPPKEMELRKENIAYFIIGEINPHTGQLTVEDRGKPVHIESSGYDHFTSRTP